MVVKEFYFFSSLLHTFFFLSFQIRAIDFKNTTSVQTIIGFNQLVFFLTTTRNVWVIFCFKWLNVSDSVVITSQVFRYRLRWWRCNAAACSRPFLLKRIFPFLLLWFHSVRWQEKYLGDYKWLSRGFIDIGGFQNESPESS